MAQQMRNVVSMAQHVHGSSMNNTYSSAKVFFSFALDNFVGRCYSFIQTDLYARRPRHIVFIGPCTLLTTPRLPSGKGLRLESGRPRVQIPPAQRFFRGRVIPVTSKLALQWLPCQAPGVIRSMLGLVGPVSVYCD